VAMKTEASWESVQKQIDAVGPGAHRLPAGSFIGGFRTPAPLAQVDRSRWAGIRNPNRNRTFTPRPEERASFELCA